MDEIHEGRLNSDASADAERRAGTAMANPRVGRAVKSTAALVADAEVLLRQRRSRLRAERELEVLRAAFRVQHGYEAGASVKRTALIDALAESFGIG